MKTTHGTDRKTYREHEYEYTIGNTHEHNMR